MSLRDPVEVLRCCERQRELMVQNWRENGRFMHNGVSSAALLIVTRGPDGEALAEPEGVPCDPPSWFVALTPPERYTHHLSEVLRRAASAWGAIGLILCSEQWMVRIEPKPGEDMTPEKAARIRAEMPASLEHAPGRGEYLSLLLCHVALGTRMWTAEITRNPTKLGPWRQQEPGGFGGRFATILETGS